jgi:hypothetical protein
METRNEIGDQEDKEDLEKRKQPWTGGLERCGCRPMPPGGNKVKKKKNSRITFLSHFLLYDGLIRYFLLFFYFFFFSSKSVKVPFSKVVLSRNFLVVYTP